METQELLKPRYKVIADYHFSPYSVGELMKQSGGQSFFITRHKDYVDGTAIDVEDYVSHDTVDKYPNLFKRLEWWEDRNDDDMPEYVKDNVGVIGKLGDRYSHNLKNCVMVTYPNGDCVVSHLDNFEPATEAEYNDYIKSKQSA